MQDYYELVGDNRIAYNMRPASFGILKTEFKLMPPVQVLDVNAEANAEYTDWVTFLAAYPLLSDPMKRILELYNPRARFKQMYLVDRSYGRQELYWVPQIPAQDVLSPETEFHAHDQTLKHLVLDRKKIKGHHFFQPEGLRETCLVVSLRAAESLLRRNLSGFNLQKVSLS
ncbi:hypothetical protein ACE3NQ_01170 [Paenibacillus terreus]|uniref:Uncharacterized protein n=1 Tax=Paenibacillus terreus TaxID=1387834 RepID=A0ABV5B1G0_9BACL